MDEIRDCVQLTLDDWMEMKKRLRLELLGVKRSFVRIGYALREIEEARLYERDGYKSIAEFAKAEYGLEPSTTSRFISINKEYSVDGYSKTLRPEFEDFGRSQLEEMLKLPEQDREMIRPETSREDIRELKRFNREMEKTAESLKEDGVLKEENLGQETIMNEPENETSGQQDTPRSDAEWPAATDGADEIVQLVADFYKKNTDALAEVREEWPDGACEAKRLAEIVNPSGSRSHRKGFLFLMMNEKEIFVKKFGETPSQMTWEEFARKTNEVLEELQKSPDLQKSEMAYSTSNDDANATFEKSGNESEIRPHLRENGQNRGMDGKNEQESMENEIAPAQKSAEILKGDGISEGRKEKQEITVDEPEKAENGQQDDTEEIPGQTTVYDFPEMLPEGMEAEGQEKDEGQQDDIVSDVRKKRMTRKRYMSKLGTASLTNYLFEELERLGVDMSVLGDAMRNEKAVLYEWLLDVVDERGKMEERVG